MDDLIAPDVIEASARAQLAFERLRSPAQPTWEKLFVTVRKMRLDEAAAAIRAADEARGLKEEREHTGRHDGLMVRLVSDWKPLSTTVQQRRRR